MSISSIQVSHKEWPVVLVTAPNVQVSDAEMDRFLAENLAFLKSKQEPFAYVIDLRDGGGITPTQRKRMGKAFEETQEALPGLCRGTAMVFTSSWMRGLLTAVLWIRKPRYETKVFTELHEALAWARRSCAMPVRASTVPGRWSSNAPAASAPPANDATDFGLSALRGSAFLRADDIRQEATAIQAKLMLENPARVDPQTIDQLTKVLIRIARYDWQDGTVTATRRVVEDLWSDCGVEVNCDLDGTATWQALQESQVLSVLVKYLVRAA